MPPKRIFQLIPQHNTLPASPGLRPHPTPPVRWARAGHPRVGRRVNPSAAGTSRKDTRGILGKVGHAATWLAPSPRRFLREEPPNYEQSSEAKSSPRKARRLRARASPASPTGRGTAGEREAASDAGAGSRRPRGATWGGRGPERAKPSGEGAGDRDEAPLPPSRPTAHGLRD